jgi:uncharacterized protein (DUF2141 family)
MATRIRKQWLDLTLSSTGLTANDIKHNDNSTSIKSAIDNLYSKMSYYTLTIVKSGTGSGTVTSNPTGINCGTTCTYQFASGSSVTLTATPDASSIFSGWLGGATGSGSTVTITMNSDIIVEAVFNTLYTLTVVKQGNGDGTITSSPAGINCGSTCSYQFVSGTNVTLTATPNSVSSFNSWSGDFSSNSSTVTITMNSNKTVCAAFTINEAGYFAGGQNGSTYYSFIDKLLFSNDSRSTLAATLSQSIRDQSACNSTLIGYFADGVWTDTNNNWWFYSFIDKLLFSNESRSTLTSVLSQTVSHNFACNSTLTGYFAGGWNIDSNKTYIYQSFIDKLLFSNESQSTLATTLSQSVRALSAFNSTISGYFSGGSDSSNIFKSFIDKLLFSNDIRTTLTTTLSQSIYHQSACNSTLSGYFAGGYNGSNQSYIDKLLFSNDSRSTLAAVLSQIAGVQAACNSTLSGYFAGGANSNYQSFIDKLLFSDETRTTLTSVLSRTVYAQSACQSGGIL